MIGWLNTARYKWAEFTGREIKFKPATFYLGVADHLARHVERQGPDACVEGQVKADEGTYVGESTKTVERAESLGPISSGGNNCGQPSEAEGLRRRTPTPDNIKERPIS